VSTTPPAPLRAAVRRWLPLAVRRGLLRAWRRYLGAGEQAPAAPVVPTGAIDEPGIDWTVRGDAITCSGWAMRDGTAASSVEVRVDGVLAGRARLGMSRPDLAALGADGSIAGWEMTVVLPRVRSRRLATISAIANFDEGRFRVRLGPRAVTVLPPTTASRTAVDGLFTRSPRAQQPRDRPHLLAVTPQLDLGGGQLYLQDLILGLNRQGTRVSVASASDGALREPLERAGVDVHLMSPWPLHDARLYADRLDELTAWATLRTVTAVVANTAGAFPGILLAARLGVPSIWAIHESFPIPALWHTYFGYDGCHPDIRAAAGKALTVADRLVFEARATAELYAPPADPARCVVVPYGIDIAALDAAMARGAARDVRQQLRVPRSARLLLSVGAFSPRKNQLMLVRAFREVADRYPAAALVLVGADDTPYTAAVRELAHGSGLGDRIRVEPVTGDLLPWYRAADVLISASDIESMPRSMIEAMACRTPVLAARVYGVPELVDDGESGWLFEQRDLDALVRGMEAVLSASPEEVRRRGQHASERVRRDHDAAGYVQAYQQFLAEVTGGRPRPES
jgi:glycosyltransferase involved in cell wall biosynthesis